ncbi:MAG: endopeptidase La [Verrucomicrobiales bacterium]|nr:endopeptidase La [Verrucomicrobiales bacterium]
MSTREEESIAIQEAAASLPAAEGARPAAPTLPDVLPVLGLSDIVVFPGLIVPLLVETPSAIRLIDDVVAGDRFVGLVLQKQPELENPGPDELWQHGCASRVLRMLKYPDNTVRVLVEGVRRMRILGYETREPYLRARHELLRDTTDQSLEVTALARQVREKFLEVVELSPALAEQVKVAVINSEEPARLSDVVAANLNLSLEARQRLLEESRVRERLKGLLPLLVHELELLTLGSKIQKEVTSSLSKSQRDYFLREQIRVIQRELGEPNGGSPDLAALQAQLREAGMLPETLALAEKELERLRQTPITSPEYTLVRNYLDVLAGLPWARSTPDKLDLAEAERVLDRQHFGLAKVKDRLLEFLAVLKLNQQIKGPILCLVGPPGVGKTSLGQSVADALGRQFLRISLGGMRDEAEIRGHRRTYVGALPGRVIQGLRRAGSNNPVLLLDELDKIGADFRGDPAAALLEVLDPTQNRAFVDHYLEVPFDLSRVLFLTTANWLDPVHPALRDRLEVIELPSYTAEEKLAIARRHLVPRQIVEHGLRPNQVRIPNATLRHLIRDYTREPGVRQLEREIAAITRKAARRLVRRRRKLPCRITPADLTSLLGPPRFLAETAERIRDCGIALGLAWTPVGGELLFIEATRMPGTGKLLLTGSLGDVMKESAQAAHSYLRAQADTLGLNGVEFDKQDLHVHVPAGATPKDGPSAGLTILVALASLLTRRRVLPSLAMTGEISLRGRVLPVGGIQEKVLAAARSGLRTLILPAQNRKDWDEVPTGVRRRLEVRFVDNLAEALEAAIPASRPAPARPRRPRRPASRPST